VDIRENADLRQLTPIAGFHCVKNQSDVDASTLHSPIDIDAPVQVSFGLARFSLGAGIGSGRTHTVEGHIAHALRYHVPVGAIIVLLWKVRSRPTRWISEKGLR
jgi:hypothetical protein